MPVYLNAKYPGPERRSGLTWPRVQPGALDQPRSSSLHIGLVNNMGDAAMCATERQFLSLLDAAAGEMLVHVTLYSLSGVERKPAGQRRVSSYYSSADQLWEQTPEQYPDALIVTGREPLTADLREEAYWPSFMRMLEWTHQQARSAVWSCLAAHGAVLALDGIERMRSSHKQFGIFTCERADAGPTSDPADTALRTEPERANLHCDTRYPTPDTRPALPHSLLAGAPATLRVPHSRWNGLSACQLSARGYQIITRTCDGGVDSFVKQDAGLFVFFQGHPEYESTTLMGEYRRDVGRYLKGETEAYPLLPLDYFDKETEQSLREIEIKARSSCQETLIAEVNAVLNSVQIQNTWRSTGALIYRNWLDHLCAQKR